MRSSPFLFSSLLPSLRLRLRNKASRRAFPVGCRFMAKLRVLTTRRLTNWRSGGGPKKPDHGGAGQRQTWIAALRTSGCSGPGSATSTLKVRAALRASASHTMKQEGGRRQGSTRRRYAAPLPCSIHHQSKTTLDTRYGSDVMVAS